MSTQILITKITIPPPPPRVVPRPHLEARLNAGLQRKLTLVSAPAGFGKTTAVSAWVARSGRNVAWLSLDEGDNDPTRFLNYLAAALKTIAPGLGQAASSLLQSPQPPPVETVLTILLNELASVPDEFVVVFDDYHVIDSKSIDSAVTFLLEHLPSKMRLVIATREDPPLALARLRGAGQLAELRVKDLRFTTSEAAGFLNEAMGLDLSSDDIATLESRTEGWIAGLQLAALSLQGHEDVTGFIQSFSGSHHFVLDYLLEEVLQRQSERVQTFLLRTSILDQLCGPLCDAVLRDPELAGQATLEYLERANLFLLPLDTERRWYRYHHLFADLLRQRLQHDSASVDATDLHRRASQWYEDQGLQIEAFQHATAANDIERAERLIEGQGVPLQFRGAGVQVLKWLESLPTTVLDASPSLWVTYATALFFTGRPSAVEHKLKAAEAALQRGQPLDSHQDLVGRIASIRATLAIIQRDAQAIIIQSRRALQYLDPDNLPMRTATTYTLGHAFQLQGERAAAGQAYADVIHASQSFGDSIYTIAATLGLGQVQESENQLLLAAHTYRRVLHLVGDPPRGLASEAHIGLARITYEWNDLEAAHQHAQQCVQLAKQMESVDTFASYAVFDAGLRLGQADVPGAVAILREAEAYVREHGFESRLPDLAAVEVRALLRQGQLTAAMHLAEAHHLPLSQARAHLAAGETVAALAILERQRRQVDARGWADARLNVRILQTIALRAHGAEDEAVAVLLEALVLAEPGGFVRSFVDEGLAMARVLSAAAAQGTLLDYIGKLQAAFEPGQTPAQAVIEPLSQRELEVLRLVAAGLSNQEIGERLFLALDTVKGHNRKIFGKLQVQRRTEAVARARELGLT